MNAKTTDTAPAAPAKKRVSVRLERKKGEPSVEVLVAGLKYTIPRGKTVEVPVAVAEVLKRRDEYAMKAMDFEESNHDDA